MLPRCPKTHPRKALGTAIPVSHFQCAPFGPKPPAEGGPGVTRPLPRAHRVEKPSRLGFPKPAAVRSNLGTPATLGDCWGKCRQRRS